MINSTRLYTHILNITRLYTHILNITRLYTHILNEAILNASECHFELRQRAKRI